MYLRAHNAKNSVSKFFKVLLGNMLFIWANTNKLFDELAFVGLICSLYWITDLLTAIISH